MAVRLLDGLGDLAAVFAASEAALIRLTRSDGEAARHIRRIGEAFRHVLRGRLFDGPVLGASRTVIDYLSVTMARESAEQLRVLFLNAGNRLIAEEVIARGSIMAAPVSPREIVRRALEIGATALILAHNHPSGDPAPSAEDIRATQEVQRAAHLFGIPVFDHIIVARDGHMSFRAKGYL